MYAMYIKNQIKHLHAKWKLDLHNTYLYFLTFLRDAVNPQATGEKS